MSFKATRKTSEGELVTAFQLARDSSGITAGIDAGFCPFEKLLQPGAKIEVLHAGLNQEGNQEFPPTDPEEFAVNPDKRYKVLTWSGTITVPDGSDVVDDVVQWYAKTTTDDRVTTYSLDYEADQSGWIAELNGSREVGERFVYATGDEEPETYEVGGPIISPTTKTEFATVYAGGGLTATLSELVDAEEMAEWIQQKLNDMKSKVDDPEESLNPNDYLESFHQEDLQIVMASVRMVHQGSGLFSSLNGRLYYYESFMAPSYQLNAGSWSMSVSDEIPPEERYYDASGFFGVETWWDDEHSPFSNKYGGADDSVASYPGSGIALGQLWPVLEQRWFSVDGKKRKIKIRRVEEGSESASDVTLETSNQEGFSNMTDYLKSAVEPFEPFIVSTYIISPDGKETVEYDLDADPPVFVDTFSTRIASIFKHRRFEKWGYRGFTNLIPLEGDPPPTSVPLDKYYGTLTIQSSGLKYSFKDADPLPPFLEGMSATAEMSGSHTLTKPWEWKLGTLDASNRWSKSNEDDQSPFKIEWSAGGKTGVEEIRISNSSGFLFLQNPPFPASGDEITITETEYQVTVDEEDEEDRDVRLYRFSWPRVFDSPSPSPNVLHEDFELDAVSGEFGDEGFTTRQKSDWTDLGLPPSGKIWASDPNNDEYTAFVGKV
jgi:hypothetical protein